VFASPWAWSNAIHQFWGRVKGSPRLPFLLPYHRRNLDAIFFQSEHAPNRESRLVLSYRKDEFGMPRLEPRVAFSRIDTETVVQFFSILDHSLRELDLGRVEYAEPELRAYLGHLMRNYCSHAHHVGTTRMAADPRDGVVDADCRVHGIHNLYIAGSSVFATSGHANPTLTLLALTLRLADCLLAAHRKGNQPARVGAAFHDQSVS
jgi:choline dehydrogenase-like flavoprotein